MLDDFKLFIMLCHFFNDANASMILTINFFLNQNLIKSFTSLGENLDMRVIRFERITCF